MIILYLLIESNKMTIWNTMGRKSKFKQ